MSVNLSGLARRNGNGNGNGHGNGNGRSNGNGHRNGNGNGLRHANGNGNGRRNGVALANGEPPFLQHMRRLVGRTVEVTTTCGTLHGTLEGVFSDHVLVRTNGDHGRQHRVRLKQICFVSPNGH